MSDATEYSAFVDAPVSKPPRRVRGLELLAVMCLLLASGSVNFVLLKVLFTAYGEANAFFVSQGINLLYVVYGGLVTYPRLLGGGIWHLSPGRVPPFVDHAAGPRDAAAAAVECAPGRGRAIRVCQ